MATATASNGKAYTYVDHKFDVVIVGAGGAGLRATLGMAEQGLKTACITRFFLPLATVAAQAALLPRSPIWAVNWQCHVATARSDWLGDVDAWRLVLEAPAAVYELEHSVFFPRTNREDLPAVRGHR